MKKIVVLALSLAICSLSQAEDIVVRYKGVTAKVETKLKDSVNVTVDGANVNIESLYQAHKLTLRLTGKSDDGALNLKTAGKAQVKLDGLTLTSQEGAPLCLKNKKKVEITAPKGTKNTLTITACVDTANHKAAVIWAKDKLLFSGKGTLDVIATGDGCRGIKSKDDITIEDLTLNVTTTGDNLGEKPFGFGDFQMPDFGEGFPGFGGDSIMGGGFPGFGGGFPGFGNDSTMRGNFPDFSQFPGLGNDSIMRRGFPNDSTMRRSFPGFGGGFPNDSTMRGNFPDFSQFPGFGGGFTGFGNDSTMMGGFPGFDGEMPDFGGGGFGGKHKYVASAKGIASKGKIIVNSGNVTVRTSTAGAEGIEGKQGIDFNGGNVDVLVPDDAINANDVITFNGAHVLAISTGNDAVDANPKNGFFMPFGSNNDQNVEPTIIITGGTVYAWSQVGSPEEGLDSDFSPLAISGGTLFTVGGGMGEMPSVPTNDTARQPTALLIGLQVDKDEPIQVCDASGKLLDTVTIPFSLRRNATLLSSPSFTLGSTYTVKTKSQTRTFTLNEAFTTVR